MPIAFDPPASAPHGTLPTRAARLGDDDAVSADIFTQLLLAAAGVQDAAAALEAAAPAKETPAAKDDTPAVVVDPTLMLPLPPAVPPVANPMVTIVAAQKHVDAHETAPVAAISSRGTAAAAAAMPATMSLPSHLTDAATALPLHALTAKASGDAASSPQADARASADVPVHAATPQAAQPEAAAARLAPPTWLASAAVADKPSAAKSAQDAALPAVTPNAAPVAPANAPIVVETVNAPAFTPGWQDETVTKLAHIVLTRNERAELKLNPAELGPVNIRVEMHAPDQASILIVAASPETRSALEQSLPQLRDLLSTQGITLGQASVQDGAAQRDPGAAPWQGDRPTGESVPVPRDNVIHLAARRADRLVDIFA